MRKTYVIVFMFSVALTIAACGRGSNPSNNTSSPTIVSPGTTLTLAANSSALVPSGTVITTPNGNTITINGTNDSINVQAGSTVTVPNSATGPANNFVSTDQSASGDIPTATAYSIVIAGSATKNDTPLDGTGTEAILWGGGGLALDGSGNIIFSDRGTLRKVTPDGVVTTLWGNLLYANPVNFQAIAIDAAGNIYGNGPDANILSLSPLTTGASINKLTTSGSLVNVVTNWEIFTGNSVVGRDGLAMDNSGNLFLTDILHNRIVKFDATGAMSVFAGNGASGANDGISTSATFSFPGNLVIDASGNLFVADSGNSSIRKITPDGVVSTFVKLPNLTSYPPMTIDPFGTIYVYSFPYSIIRIDPKGNMISFLVPEISDHISGMVADSKGNLYIGTRGVGAQILKVKVLL